MKPGQFGALITSLVVSVLRKRPEVVLKLLFNIYINKRSTHKNGIFLI